MSNSNYKYQSVLFIDDDPITLMLCKKVIEKTQFSLHVDTLTNGKDALKYLNEIYEKGSKIYPDLIFLDLNMPVMDGWEFLDALSKTNLYDSNLNIIILSSTIDPKDIEKAKNYSIVKNFISKPITSENLLRISK
ncbi:response regulator [Flavobacterium croceum]|uniref:response regulator n=1 Tax=Flavobacterium croceum TaxID=370975 RepID=UPI0024A7E111|nr:response regulator [Flavobacterium croceum]